MWLHTSYSILVQLKDTTQVQNSGVTDEGTRVRTSPWQDKCKNLVPSLFLFIFRCAVYFFGLLYFFGFQQVVAFCVFRKFLDCCFPVISGFSRLYRNQHTDTLSFLKFFLNVGEKPPTVASGPLSATFPGLSKSSSYAKKCINQHGFSNVTWTTVSLPRPMLTTKLFTMHFAMVGFRKLRVVWR